jgi:hypothetical protein
LGPGATVLQFPATGSLNHMVNEVARGHNIAIIIIIMSNNNNDNNNDINSSLPSKSRKNNDGRSVM